MKLRIQPALLCAFALLLMLLNAPISYALPKVHSFNFAVIGQNASRDDAALLDSIKHVNQSKSLFFVVHGVRPILEPCTDAVFQKRRKILNEAGKPAIISLAARDWAECKNEKGESAAQERLNYLRGMLFENIYTTRESNIQIVRQSSAVKFRHYAENARWESGGIQFATINLPSNNNHYLAAAGGNNEFEDRLIANRTWLQRVFSHAKSRKMKGIVLFTDGNPLPAPAKFNRSEQRDGFAEMRKQIAAMAARFPGKVLLIHGQHSAGNIAWHDNLGVVGAGRGVIEVDVRRGTNITFSARKIDEIRNAQ